MAEGFQRKEIVFTIAITWILSLITTLAVVYVSPYIFPPLTSEKIADGAIITNKLADGAVTSAKILDGTITAIDLSDGAIVTIKVANGSITTEKIADEAVTTIKLAHNSITSEKILDGSITTLDLADDVIITSKIADNAITTVKLADGSVTSIKILDGTIIADDLSDGSIISVKIADGAVTTNKIADYAVTNLKLSPYAIPFASTHTTDTIVSTNSTNWNDLPGMSITLTLNRTSHLLIMFSSVIWNDMENRLVLVRAMVGNEEAFPEGGIPITPFATYYLEAPAHSHALIYGGYSYTFYKPLVNAGTYTIKMQWRVNEGNGHAALGSLTVIALPA